MEHNDNVIDVYTVQCACADGRSSSVRGCASFCTLFESDLFLWFIHGFLQQILHSRFLHDSQCTYNLTLRRVRATIVAVESITCYTTWVCICSPRYPAYNAHAPYCHLHPVWVHYIFTSSHKWRHFRKKLL